MTKHFVVALSHVVFGHIEQSLVVSCPRDVIDAFDLFGHQLTGFQILYLERVLTITSVVG